MKKLIFVFGLFVALVMAISCKNPNVDTPDEPEETTKSQSTETSTETPVENPKEDLSVDYYCLGEMLFADSMDFSKWWFTAGTYPHSSFEGTILKVEKVARVHNPNKNTAMYRYSETLKDVEYVSGNWFYVEYATKYKVWVSKDFINPENKQYWKSETVLFNLEGSSAKTGNGMIDGTWIKLTYSQNENLEDVYTFEYKDQDKAQYYN